MPSETTQFKRGQSGNPGGRPKGRGLSSRVRETAPPEKLADYFEAIWLLNHAKLAELDIDPKECTLKERTAAAHWLADRGYGKAVDFVPIDDDDPLERNQDDLDRFLENAIEELAQMRAKEIAEGTGAPFSVRKTGNGTRRIYKVTETAS